MLVTLIYKNADKLTSKSARFAVCLLCVIKSELLFKP